MDEELKPCPFCGGQLIALIRDKHGMQYSCVCCECRGPRMQSSYNAMALWNRRAIKDSDGWNDSMKIKMRGALQGKP